MNKKDRRAWILPDPRPGVGEFMSRAGGSGTGRLPRPALSREVHSRVCSVSNSPGCSPTKKILQKAGAERVNDLAAAAAVVTILQGPLEPLHEPLDHGLGAVLQAIDGPVE